jgi:hypothetical protein
MWKKQTCKGRTLEFSLSLRLSERKKPMCVFFFIRIFLAAEVDFSYNRRIVSMAQKPSPSHLKILANYSAK